MPIQRPRLVNVARPLLADPPLGREHDMTSYRLRTLFTIINCAQQLVAQDPLWKIDREVAKETWRTGKRINFTLPVAKLCRWCRCKPKVLLLRLERFMRPIADRSAPVLKYTLFNNANGMPTVSISLNMSWVHLTDYYSKVKLLGMPCGNAKKCRQWLRRILPEHPGRRGMSKTKPSKPQSFFD